MGTNNPGYPLDVETTSAGAVAYFKNSAGSCSITPTGGSVQCSSDIRLKKDISPLGSALEEVLKLEAVQYHWKSEAASEGKHIGFIAQAVEKVFPQLVGEDKLTGMKQLNYAGFTPILVQAVQELYTKWSGIDQKILALEQENAALKAQIEQQNAALMARIQILEHAQLAAAPASMSRSPLASK
jgi:uncharacterized protein YdgA (DUF945 family)